MDNPIERVVRGNNEDSGLFDPDKVSVPMEQIIQKNNLKPGKLVPLNDPRGLTMTEAHQKLHDVATHGILSTDKEFRQAIELLFNMTDSKVDIVTVLQDIIWELVILKGGRNPNELEG